MNPRGFGSATAALLALIASSVGAQSLYKYRGADGEWHYADRPPEEGAVDEVRALDSRPVARRVTVRNELARDGVVVIASNPYHAPVEIVLLVDEIRGVRYPDRAGGLHWVLPPSSDTSLLRLEVLDPGGDPHVRFRFKYLLGDPGARHQPPDAYRVPVSVAQDFPVTQAFPDVVTHASPADVHAVDIAMPIGTDIFAARAGIVFDVASNNYRGGLDPVADAPAANVVRILHDDGTYAIYAHLNWNSIRVKPGDVVRRGEYIADSGNTGFSSGPHLHFAVVRNAGLRVESVPVTFKGAGAEAVVPATGRLLTAY